MRRYPEALEISERVIDLAPDQIWSHLCKAFTLWGWKGSMVEAQTSLQKLPPDHPWSHWALFGNEMIAGRYQGALDYLATVKEDWIRIKICARPICLFAAYAHELLGEPDLARAGYDSARALLEPEIQAWPQDPRYHSSLGIALAALGQAEAAVAAGQQAVNLLPVSKDAVYGPSFVIDMAHIYTLLGKEEEAVQQLEILLAQPSWISVPFAESDPRWRSLRHHPGYQELMVKYSREPP
jgi:tetratricopeptide (TPR) repeat protein